MRKIAITFGDGNLRWRNSAKRLERELNEIDFFDEIFSFDLFRLIQIDEEVGEFILKHLLGKDLKGCGYWIWKSSLVLWAKNRFPKDMIYYLDAGFSLINRGSSILQFEEFTKNALISKGLVLQLPSHTERQYTKKETIEYIDPNHEFIDTNQVQAGFMVVPPIIPVAFFEEWRRIMLMRDGFYLRDELGGVQDPNFIAHRNDQSIFSLLWKQNGFGRVLDITDPSSGADGIVATRYATRFSPTNTNFIVTLLRFIEKFVSRFFTLVLDPLRLRFVLWKMSKQS